MLLAAMFKTTESISGLTDLVFEGLLEMQSLKHAKYMLACALQLLCAYNFCVHLRCTQTADIW